MLFFLVQAGAISILFTGGNTSFSGFPFLTSFVAEDSFLPRWLSKRGHRLVFSNGIIVLTVLALTLLLVVGANINNLVPFYAIGVFTGFSMAGFGMARYHRRTKEPGWRRRRVINFTAGVYTALVVVIFAVVKFTEGAWLVVVGVPGPGVRCHPAQPRSTGWRPGCSRPSARGKPPEPPNYARRTVLVFVDDFDLATIAALRYARSLRPTTLRAVHFVIDQRTSRRAAAANGCAPTAAFRSTSWTAPTGGSTGPPANSPPRRPASPAPTSPWCCHGAATRRCSAGSCTTGPPTRSPGW